MTTSLYRPPGLGARRTNLASCLIMKPKKKTARPKYRSLKYKKTALKVNPLGLGFPDNFMAIMGWKRVYEK